jgi:sec-independent protein translocase protein TatB
MFGIDSSELLVIGLVALLVIGPKDLPRAMRWLGQWTGKARAMSRHLRTGFDAMMRESELEEMQKLWAAQNDAIMRASALPENALPDLSGPNLAGPIPSETSYDPWPTAPVPDVPALPGPEATPAVAAEPPAKPKRQRKPRVKPATDAPQSDTA